MARAPRADEAGGLYHVLNRGNSRSEILHKEADYEAFERILAEGLECYDVQLYCYQLMPNHWHLVLRPNQDGEMSNFMRWITATKSISKRNRQSVSLISLKAMNLRVQIGFAVHSVPNTHSNLPKN